MDPDWTDFINSDTFSQIVVSESAATCILNSFANSEIGQVQLNKGLLNEMFGKHDLEWTSSSLVEQLPMFNQTLGEDVPLKLTLHFKDITVLFGQFDSDIILEYTACMSWKRDLLGSTEFLYDELKMITSLDLAMDEDISYIHILNHKLDLDTEFGQRSQPIRNTLDLTDDEYREFIRTFGFMNNWLKKWMNEEYLDGGVPNAYNIEEFKTYAKFQTGSMHFMLEVEANAE